MKKRIYIGTILIFVISLGVFGFTKIYQDRKPITMVEFNKRTTIKDKTVLVYFSASWCAICHKMKPVIEQIETEYKTKIDILFIDTEIDKEVAEEFDANSLPLIIYYRNGVKQWDHVGKIEKAAIKEKIGVD